jgi:hypothetical protein
MGDTNPATQLTIQGNQNPLTLTLLTWTIWRAPTNASKWRMGFNSAIKGLKYRCEKLISHNWEGGALYKKCKPFTASYPYDLDVLTESWSGIRLW